MADYICIDGGTTNTRLRLVRSGAIVDTKKLSLGAGAGKEGIPLLEAGIKAAIASLLAENGLTERDVCRILASGMITSEYGLRELKHAPLPAGLRELHDAMEEVLFPQISSVPFVFLRGLKAQGKTVARTDIMRGEETELMGILGLTGGSEGVYILPGSHSKTVFTDPEGRITDFFTTMTGEMLSALSCHTILKHSVDLEQGTLSEDALLAGYDCCLSEGLPKALFKVRICDTVYRKDQASLYSFFLGVVLCEEITQILKTQPKRIVLGGRQQLREAMYRILSRRSQIETLCLPEETVDSCVCLGAVRIYEYKGE